MFTEKDELSSSSQWMTEADTRALVHLLGKACMLRGVRAPQRKLIFHGLSHLLGATEWRFGIWNEREGISRGLLQGGAGNLVFWPEGFCLVKDALAEQAAGPGLGSMFVEAKRGEPRSGMIFHRDLENDERGWLLLLAESAFTAREHEMAEMLFSSIEWLLEPPFTTQPAAAERILPKLSARQREVLGLMLDGIKRREVALKMGLSQQTVATHAKVLYRKLGVASQSELLQLARQGKATGL